MKKKILAVLLSAAMVAAMAMGCSSGGGTSAKADGEKAGKAEDMTFVVVGVNGTPASADYAEKMHKVIKACLREIFGDVADEIPVLYGGSVNPGNANELIVQPSIDGLFTGRAAWQADNFDKLIRDAKATYEAK